jgi:hypothetical protein
VGKPVNPDILLGRLTAILARRVTTAPPAQAGP